MIFVCGIAGMLNMASDKCTVSSMLETMRRRGPDDNGVYEDDSCCLLHSRLTVIDPVGGKQPMVRHHGGETYVLVYNGELYNTDEIRKKLINLGHVFDDHSDTAVVLHSYIQWGAECLQVFNGIYAFAVWESNKKRLFLARDRMGVKPLFYAQQGEGFIFASEIKTILAHPRIDARVDSQGIAEILLLGPGRTPGCGVFQYIRELPAGYYGYHAKGKFFTCRYWKLYDREHTENFEQTAEQVKFLVTDAIKRQMVSDVPIGTFLSGGLDSSIISAVCADAKRQSGEVLPTFSIDYQDNDKYFKAEKFQPNSDNAYIKIMNETIGSRQHWTTLNTDDLFGALEEATFARDLPGMADVDFSLLLFCGQIKPHVKVALSGECADEIFGGYPWYRDPDVRASNGFPWAQNIVQRAAVLHREHLLKIDPVAYVQDRYHDTIRDADILPGTKEEDRRIKELVVLNQSWFMQTLLDRKDRMSMYNGLEVRVPFCDHRIAEYLYGIPWEYKNYMGREKGLLRYSVRDILPREIFERKKSPYPKTYDPKYLQLVTDALKAVIADKSAPIHQIVSKTALENIMDDDHPWPWYGQLMRKPQTIAYFLQINHWLKKYKVEIV